MHLMASGRNFATYRLGARRVTSLRDGYVDMPPSRLHQPGNRPFGDHLPAQVTLVGGNLRLSVNAFAVQSETGLTLIDTGAANAWLPTMGLLCEAFHESGLSMESVDTVALTHTHIDHVNGLVRPDGEKAFPNLRRLYVPEHELALFRAEGRLRDFHDIATPIEDGQPVNDAISAIAAPGHEIGHTCFHVSSEGEHLLVWGDIVDVPSIQFAQPALTWEFDADQDAARESRLRMMALAADRSWSIIGAHLDFPGVGRISRSGDAFAFAAL